MKTQKQESLRDLNKHNLLTLGGIAAAFLIVRSLYALIFIEYSLRERAIPTVVEMGFAVLLLALSLISKNGSYYALYGILSLIVAVIELIEKYSLIKEVRSHGFSYWSILGDYWLGLAVSTILSITLTLIALRIFNDAQGGRQSISKHDS